MNIFLSLYIDNYTSIELLSDKPLELVDNLYTIWFEVWLKTTDGMYCLRKCTNGYELFDYIERIQLCINDARPILIHDTIDLGLLWNDYWEKYVAIEYGKENFDIVKWEYRQTIFLEYNSLDYMNTATFLYKNAKNDIVLQVSKAYPWLYKEPSALEVYIPYDDWLPQYKILYKTVIPKDVAQKWVQQLSDVYAQLEANMLLDK